MSGKVLLRAHLRTFYLHPYLVIKQYSCDSDRAHVWRESACNFSQKDEGIALCDRVNRLLNLHLGNSGQSKCS